MATNFPISRSKLLNYNDPTTALKFKFKQINSEYKVFSEDLQKFLLDFFKSNAYPKKSEDAAVFYFANKLGSNLIKFISERQNNKASDSEISSHKIDGKTIERYIADIFNKDINEINSAIDGYTFTAKELQDFKKEVLKNISDAIDQSFSAAKKNLSEKDSFISSDAAAASSKIFQKHRGLFTSQNIHLPKIDFDKVNLFLKNGAFKKFSNESKAYASKLAEKSNRRIKGDVSQMTDSEIFALKMKEIGQRIKENKTVIRINTVKEQFLTNVIPSFREFHFRLGRFEQRLEKWAKLDLRRSLKDFGRKMTLRLKLAIAFVFPISEVLFLVKAASKIVSFSLRMIRSIHSSFKRILGFVSRIGKTALYVLEKSLSLVYRSAKFVFTSKIFRAFFSTYIGAYVLGYGIGFMYAKLKKYFGKAQEAYFAAKIKLSDIYGAYSEEIEELKRRASEFSSSVTNSLMAIGYTAEDFVEQLFAGKDFDTALKDSLNKIKSGETGASLRLGTDLEKITEAVEKFFTLDNLNNIIEAFKSSAAATVVGFLGSTVGATIGGALGTAIAGPFGTIPGALIGSFVGDYLTSFLFPRNTKVESIETEYQAHTRSSYGRVSEFSSIGEFDLGESSFKKQIETILKKITADEELSANEEEFLQARGISLSNQQQQISALEGMSSIYNVSNKLVTNEINSAKTLLLSLGNKKKFENEDDSKKARTTLLKLFNGYNEINSLAFSDSDRLALVYRLYRAIAIGNLIPRLYDRTLSESEFLKYYKELDNPNISTIKNWNGFAVDYQTFLADQNLLRDGNFGQVFQELVGIGEGFNQNAAVLAEPGKVVTTRSVLENMTQVLNSKEYGFGISTSGMQEYYRGVDRSVLDEVSDSQLRKTTREINARNAKTLADLQKLFEDQEVKSDVPALQAINARLIELNRDIRNLNLSGAELEKYQTQLLILSRNVGKAVRDNLARRDSGAAPSD